MKFAQLIRLRLGLNNDPTIGVLRVGGSGQWLWTLERPWRDNQRNVSCIPCGTYAVERVFNRVGLLQTFEVMEVPNRGGILFHPLNRVHETRGCIGPGMQVRREEQSFCLYQSRIAFDLFLDLFEHEKYFTLEIAHHEKTLTDDLLSFRAGGSNWTELFSDLPQNLAV